MAGPWENYAAPAEGPWAKYQDKPEASLADNAADVAWQLPQGINRGVDSVLNLPYNAIRGVGKLTGTYDLPEAQPIVGQFNPGGAVPRAVADAVNPVLPASMQQESKPRPPETTAGRYAESVGEAVGASAIPAGTLLGTASRAAALAPTTTARAVAQAVGRQAASNPGGTLAVDVAAATSSGLAQQGAEDAGFGPGGQAVAGMVGGLAPVVATTAITPAVRAVRQARVNASPEGRALNSLGDTTIDDLATGVATGETNMQTRESRRAFDILGEEMVATGGNRQQAQRNTIDRLQRTYGLSRSGAEDNLRRVINAQADNELMVGEYPAVIRSNADTRHMRSGNITDEAAGAIDDTGLQWEIDRIANAGSGASATSVRNAINDRLPELRQQMRERLQEMGPDDPATGVARTIQDVDAMAARGTRQARVEYDAAHNGPVNYGLLHGLLNRIVERNLNRVAGRSDDQAKALNEAINRLYTSRPAGAALQPDHIPGLEDQLSTARQVVREMRRQKAPKAMIDNASRQAEGLAEELRLARREGRPTEQQVLMPSLQMLQDMRTGIRGQMTAARNSGRQDIVNVLQPFYRDITRAMQRASPQWAVANRRWADLELGEVAERLGDAFALQAGPRFREQLQDFRRMAPEAQDIARVHFVQKLLDKVENNPDTHDLAKLFSTPHVKQMVRTVLGDEAAVSLARVVRDNKVATKSKNMLGGSQTAARLARQKEDDTDLGLLASVDQANLGSFRKLLLDWTVNVVKERRNRGLARLVTTPVRDTAGTAEIIERMRSAAAVRQQAQQPLNPLMGYSGIIGSPAAATDDYLDDQNRLNLTVRPR